MTDRSTESGDWSGVWLDAQRKYWESWLSLSKRTFEVATGKDPSAGVTANTNPWARSLESWSKLMKPELPTDARAATGTLVGMAQSYLGMAEEFWTIMRMAQSAADAGAGWKSAMDQAMDQLRRPFAGAAGQRADPWSGFATFWGLPLDTWRRMASAFSPAPGDFDQAFRSEGAMYHPGETLRGELSRALSTPPLGYTREWQEAAQRWWQLWLEHGKALQEYAGILNRIGERAVELMGAKLVAMANKDDQFDSLRAMYNTWTDCGEEAYAEVAGTADFTGVQARLVNTMMALKRQEQFLVEEALGSMNMPTRRELNTTHRRIHELRRQCRRTGEALEALDIAQLRKELSNLRAAAASQGASEAAAPRPEPVAGAGPAAKPNPKRSRSNTKVKRT